MNSTKSTSGIPAIAEEAERAAAPDSTPVVDPEDGQVDVSSVARHGAGLPVKNLRITFWGVQGSCPLFPEPHEVEEYKNRVFLYALGRVFEDIKAQMTNGHVSIEDLLGGPLNASTLKAYQKKLGTPDLPVYGGETTCISIETSDGHTILIDGGSGIRHSAKYMIPAWGDRPRVVHVLGTHEHLDHRSGLPFCQFCFTRPPFTLNVYGTYQFLNALDSRYGIFSHQLNDQMHFDDPVDYRMLAASFKGTELRSYDGNDSSACNNNNGNLSWQVHDLRQPIIIGNTRITAFDVYHGATRCLSYKFQHNDVTFLFSTDHELRHTDQADDPRQIKSVAAEARLQEHSQDADLAYYDGQYLLNEYLGREKISSTSAVPRIDWGHGCIEDIVERSRKCGVKRTFIGHHDPERSWPDLLKIDRYLLEQYLKSGVRIELARSDVVLDI